MLRRSSPAKGLHRWLYVGRASFLEPTVKAFVLVFTIAAMVLAAPVTAAPKRAKTAASSSKTSVSALPETQQYIQASRALDAATGSGVNVTNYSKLVTDLHAATLALDEVLDAKSADELRSQLAFVLDRHQRAKEFWSACIGDSAYRHGFVFVRASTLAAEYARRLLTDFPSLNRPMEEGGAMTAISESSGYSTVYVSAVLQALWLEANEASKAVRQSLR